MIVLSTLVIGLYALVLFILMLYGFHRYWILLLYWRAKGSSPIFKQDDPTCLKMGLDPFAAPQVTVQLPIYNEMYVVERLIETVCRLDYPKEKLEIQVLDDSTDRTVEIAREKVEDMRRAGYDIVHLRRNTREGFKAGALAWGLTRAKGEYVAIFDADFMPPPAFLKATLPYFTDPGVGMVQTRWGHINANYSLLTRVQALFLDGHFLLEHTARYKSGAFFNFNGTAGIWRRRTIEEAGGWSARTLTEDLDLSYRAQLKGWRFVYVPEFVCPAELPVDIHAFRSQQSRWTKGALQVAKYILKDLWRARLPLHTKLEATVHLTGNLGYLLTVLVALLLLPALLLRGHVNFGGLETIEISVFIATSISISFFYVVSQRELYPDWRWKIRDIPALLSIGIGMCVCNAAAVVDGLLGRGSEFIRTPKYNIQNRKDTWMKKAYSIRAHDSWALQFFFAAYSALTLFIAALHKSWGALPFISLFLFGFSYVTALCLLHNYSRD